MQEKQEHPLILTLRLDDESASFFNKQRERYFPPDRNFLSAHLTLFHQLPATQSTCQSLLKVKQTVFKVNITGLINLGAGVAYRVEGEELHNLRSALFSVFANDLIPQDRQGFRPHITVQNKVTPQEAKALHTVLTKDFDAFRATAIGLDLWTYLSGPWRHETYYPFS